VNDAAQRATQYGECIVRTTYRTPGDHAVGSHESGFLLPDLAEVPPAAIGVERIAVRRDTNGPEAEAQLPTEARCGFAPGRALGIDQQHEGSAGVEQVVRGNASTFNRQPSVRQAMTRSRRRPVKEALSGRPCAHRGAPAAWRFHRRRQC
jgi:hypothetical protein